MKNKSAIIVAIILIACALFGGIKYQRSLEIKTSINAFMTYLCNNNIQEAVSLSAGNLAWKLQTSSHVPIAQPIKIDTRMINYNSNWARAYTNIEMILDDGNIGMSWYELDMIYDGKWKVFDIRETMPKVSDSFKPSIGELQQVVEQYVDLIYAGDQDAKKHLVGPARSADENAGQKPFLRGKPQNLQLQVLYGNNLAAVAKTTYTIDDQKINTIITFCKSAQGWKIAYIQSL